MPALHRCGGGRCVASDTRQNVPKVKREPASWEEPYLRRGSARVSRHCFPCLIMTREEISGQDANKDGGAQGLQMPVEIKTPKNTGKSNWEAFLISSNC